LVAPRLSASLHIADDSSGDERKEVVRAGSVLELGSQRFCVVRIQPGTTSAGAIVVRQLGTPVPR
jgi:hypothetical protein